MIGMMVGYPGKIINGQPTLIETVALPDDSDIMVMVELPHSFVFKNRTKALDPQQQVVTKQLLSMEEKAAIFESLKGVLPSDVDLDSARDERIRKRGLMDV